ncbi:MAG: LON peptidase substrate-binding domain-containing protein, partial [Pseudomonadota bacterium]
MTDSDAVTEAEILQPNTGPHTPAVADDVLPDTLCVMPIPNRPFFPGQVQPVALNPQQWESTLKTVSESGHGLLGLSYVADAEPGSVEPRQFPEIGCVVRLHKPPAQMGEQPGHFLAQGVKRFRIVRWLSDKPPYLVQVEYPRSQGDRNADEVKAYTMALIKEIKELLPLNPLYSEELKQYLSNFSPNKPSLLSDFSAALTTASGEQLQE